MEQKSVNSEACVGLIYNDMMTKHEPPSKSKHNEIPARITKIWERLEEILDRCSVTKQVHGDDDVLALVHTQKHIKYIESVNSNTCRTKKFKEEFGEDMYFNEYSASSAKMAAHCAVKAADQVACGEVKSAFAVVRPPGHHATRDESMGFCLFNNVAIAASYLLKKRGNKVKKILIVDWDVHHGNGTQEVFYEDDRVLFFSVHRYEPGSYPLSDAGSYRMRGKGRGLGFNINVPLEEKGAGNADYLAIWDHILIPVARKYEPDVVIVSSGFDAATGDPIGDCRVTSKGFGVLLSKLKEFAEGRIVMVLEGGYNVKYIPECALACVKELLKSQKYNISPKDVPLESTILMIKMVREALCEYWPVLGEIVPALQKISPMMISSRSHMRDISEVEEEIMQQTQKLASLAISLGKEKSAAESSDATEKEK